MPSITKQYKFCAAHKYWNPKWDEDKIVWYKQEKLENGKLMRSSGVLDRYTGRYDYEKKILKDALEVSDSVLITWKCNAKQKKF